MHVPGRYLEPACPYRKIAATDCKSSWPDQERIFSADGKALKNRLRVYPRHHDESLCEKLKNRPASWPDKARQWQSAARSLWRARSAVAWSRPPKGERCTSRIRSRNLRSTLGAPGRRVPCFVLSGWRGRTAAGEA